MNEIIMRQIITRTMSERKSGESRKLFGTNGIRGIPNELLTFSFCSGIGAAIGSFAKGEIIALARDTRRSGDFVGSAVSAGIMSTGKNVVDLGVIPTPALQLYCKNTGRFGVVITASHNPPQFNGIKCIDSDGTELRSEDEAAIEQLYFSSTFRKSEWTGIGTLLRDYNQGERYVENLVSLVDADRIRSRHFKVVIDTGNGAAYSTSPALLTRLGCRVVSLNSNPDGLFTSRNAEPRPENLAELMQVMKSGRFDLGVAHDGDADRAVFIDEKGNFVEGENTLALVIKHMAGSGDTIVTPVSSSDIIDEVCREKSLNLVKTRVGAPIVARTMIERQARLGGEENGGVIIGDNQYCRDGGMTVAKILDIMAKTGKPLSTLVGELPRYVLLKKSIETEGKPWNKMRKLAVDSFPACRRDETDGLKIFFDEGWALIRPSGTEPIVRVYVNTRDEGDARRLMEKVMGALKH